METPEMHCDVPLYGRIAPPEIEAGTTDASPVAAAGPPAGPHFPAPSSDAAGAAPAALTRIEVATEREDVPFDATHWTARLLAPAAADEAEGVAHDARRLAIGLGLASIYGLAAGARQGGLAFVSSAALVPAALLGACVFGLPALYIALGMVDAPLAPRRLFAAAARATASAGLVLAGLAPVAALYVVSSGDREGAAIATILGLAVGSLAGLRALWRDVAADVRASEEAVKVVTVATLSGFALFAAAVGCRVWMHLPIFASGAR